MKKLSFLVAGLFLTLSTSAFANNEFDGDHVHCSRETAFAAGTVTIVDLTFNKEFSKVKAEVQQIFDGGYYIRHSEEITGIAGQTSLNGREFILQNSPLGIDKMDITPNKNFVVLVNSSTRLGSDLECKITKIN